MRCSERWRAVAGAIGAPRSCRRCGVHKRGTQGTDTGIKPLASVASERPILVSGGRESEGCSVKGERRGQTLVREREGDRHLGKTFSPSHPEQGVIGVRAIQA